MEEKIKIENENLANYVMFKLDKLDNEFTEQELNQITEVVLDYNEYRESSFIFIKELEKLKNLKSITIRNGYIYNNDYNIFLNLNNLSEFVFERCEFEKVELIASLKLKSLSLINCKIDSYSFISVLNLEELTITNGRIEMNRINMLKNLKYLQLSYSNIIDNNYLNLDKIEELYIDNTNINKFDFLNKFKNLRIVSIDKNQYYNNKDFFDNLSKNNVLVLEENMIEFGGEDNGI